MLKETKQRLSTPPATDYWVKVRTIGITLVAVATAIVSIPESVILLPLAVITGAKIVIGVGATLGITAQATKK